MIVNSIILTIIVAIMHGGCYAAMAMQVDGVQNFVIVWKTTVQGGDTMMPVLMGMLGLGAMRSVEKVRGVSREK